MSGIYSATELQTYSLEKLYALYHTIQQELRKHAPGTPEHKDALANLDCISHAINVRHFSRNFPRPGF